MAASNVSLSSIEGHHYTPVSCPRLEQCIFHAVLAIVGAGHKVFTVGDVPGWRLSQVVLHKNKKVSPKMSNYRRTPFPTHSYTPQQLTRCDIISELTHYQGLVFDYVRGNSKWLLHCSWALCSCIKISTNFKSMVPLNSSWGVRILSGKGQ